MKGGRSLPFLARGSPHVALGLCILITVCERAGLLARATDAFDIAAAPVGDAPFCAKSIDDEARAEVPFSDWCSGAGGVAGGVHGAYTEGVRTYLRGFKVQHAGWLAPKALENYFPFACCTFPAADTVTTVHSLRWQLHCVPGAQGGRKREQRPGTSLLMIIRPLSGGLDSSTMSHAPPASASRSAAHVAPCPEPPPPLPPLPLLAPALLCPCSVWLWARSMALATWLRRCRRAWPLPPRSSPPPSPCDHCAGGAHAFAGGGKRYPFKRGDEHWQTWHKGKGKGAGTKDSAQTKGLA